MSEKSSDAIMLVLLGLIGASMALPYLPQGEEVRRNTYRSRNDCVADYSEAECETTPASGDGSWGYHGPTYRKDSQGHPEDPGPGRYSKEFSKPNPAVIHTESSFRGGFGNISRRFGSGG